jgi:hypothetical protein
MKVIWQQLSYLKEPGIPGITRTTRPLEPKGDFWDESLQAKALARGFAALAEHLNDASLNFQINRQLEKLSSRAEAFIRSGSANGALAVVKVTVLNRAASFFSASIACSAADPKSAITKYLAEDRIEGDLPPGANKELKMNWLFYWGTLI